ncbi:hypothetical protein P3X46_020809 [Hevea brasiliensis]|uniref:Cytochrome P450 n=1 Tax=Hevea brasiliensis TaxID=3981 RepID=A0ABQ9LDL0_HEVBR|nr:hypothetical protein P3X46_020809 [Hevea brasiliensis]
MAKEVLKTQDLEFCSRPRLLGLQKLSYNGLDLAFALYDAYWREMRKICVVHLFNSNRVQDFRPIREDEVSRMLESISKLADDSKPVNLTEAMMALTISAICRVAFGKGFEEGGKEAKRFHALLNETQAMFVGFFFSNYIPYIGWVVDKLCGLLSRLEKNFHEFDVFYQKLIDEHLDLKREKPEYENILDVALQICKDRSSKVQRTYEHIKAILMVMESKLDILLLIIADSP